MEHFSLCNYPTLSFWKSLKATNPILNLGNILKFVSFIQLMLSRNMISCDW